MICELQINFFFHPFGILWYKFLSYIEVLCVLSEFSKLLELSELIELPEVFSSMKKCLFHGALRLGDPLIKLLELRFVSSSSETSRSSGTIQTSQSSISSHPVFPDAVAFYPSFCQLMHKQPPGHHSSIPALVPGGAMCTAGMAMPGSAFLQPTGCMLHVSKCSIVIDFCTKPC